MLLREMQHNDPPCFIHDQVLSLLFSHDPDRRRACLDPQLLRPMRRTNQFAMDTTGLGPEHQYQQERILQEIDLEQSWHEVFQRDSILGRQIRSDQLYCNEQPKFSVPKSISLNRLCIVSDAGMGKSILIEWLLYRLNANQGTEAGNLAIKIDLSELEKVWKKNSEDSRRTSFFDVLIQFVADRTLTTMSISNPPNLEVQRTAMELLLAQRAQDGKLTLLADGLDQIADKSQLLAEFLSPHNPKLEKIRLIVAGRSNSILMQWSQAFSNDAWTFVRVEPFTCDQQIRYLGWIDDDASTETPAKRVLRYSKIPETAREILCIPRVLEYLREIKNYEDLNTAADVYFKALDQMITRGMVTRPEEYANVQVSEVFELLARQAFHSFLIQLNSAVLTFASGKPSKATDPVPTYLYDIRKFGSVPQYDQFKEQICQRAYGGLKTKYEQVWNAVQHLNQFLNYGIFDLLEMGQTNRRIVWANRSLHEFLLAYYFANYASEDESKYLWDWIYLPDRNDTDQYYPFWQFLCEMPEKARTPEVWLRSIEMLYQPNIRIQPSESKEPSDDGYPFYSKRSNEMIYRSWATLDAYTHDWNAKIRADANRIRNRWWGEFESGFLRGEYGSELKAHAEDITTHLLRIPAGTVTMGTTRERQVWPELIKAAKNKLNEFRDESMIEKYFKKYPFFETRSGKFEKERRRQKIKTILQEPDPEKALLEFLEVFFGFTYVSNPELSIDAFDLGRQTISNAWYRLYSPRHTQIWREYRQYSETLNHPAVAITFFDAWVYCQWLRWDGQSCRLPWETEWEYAAKYKFPSWELEYWWEGIEHLKNPDRLFTKSRINCKETTDTSQSNDGCTVVPDLARASSESKELDRGSNGQLMDMQGNTWEWCQDIQRPDYGNDEQESSARQKSLRCNASVSRVLRGGSFNFSGRNASASFRLHYVPTVTDIINGFRVARAPKGKP